MSYKILFVDDEPANLRLLERLFRRDYQVLTANSGEEALRTLDQHDVALLITDQRMPGMTGIELLERIAEFRPHMVRILLTGYTDVGALVQAINSGQVYKYVTKPWNNDELRLTVSRALEHYESTKARHEFELANKRLKRQLEEMSRGFMQAITETLEARDHYFLGHGERVGIYATSIGQQLSLNCQLLDHLAMAATLHDLGHLAIPDSILLKQGRLTPEERAVIQLHPDRGAKILSIIPEMEDVAATIRSHHENFDGTGYPDGLKGHEIPLTSRILRVADVFDALVSPRPFRQAWSPSEALLQIDLDAGTLFDPEIVAALRASDAIKQPGTVAASIAHTFEEHDSEPAVPAGPTFGELVFQVESNPELAQLVLQEANADPIVEPTNKIHVACGRLGETGLRALLERHHVDNVSFSV